MKRRAYAFMCTSTLPTSDPMHSRLIPCPVHCPFQHVRSAESAAESVMMALGAAVAAPPGIWGWQVCCRKQAGIQTMGRTGREAGAEFLEAQLQFSCRRVYRLGLKERKTRIGKPAWKALTPTCSPAMITSQKQCAAVCSNTEGFHTDTTFPNFNTRSPSIHLMAVVQPVFILCLFASASWLQPALLSWLRQLHLETFYQSNMEGGSCGGEAVGCSTWGLVLDNVDSVPPIHMTALTQASCMQGQGPGRHEQ